MIPLSVEASYFNTKRIMLDGKLTDGVQLNHVSLSLPEAYKIWDAIGRALKESGYPGESHGAGKGEARPS